MRADLHVHSSASDGTDPPAEVMRRAARAGLDAVALTDHDTVAGHAEARLALPDTLTLVPGMELSCRLGGRSLHLLGYLFDPADAELAAELGRIRDDRVLRARAMVRRLADLGAPVTWEQVAGIAGPAVVGRPHIARAMVASGVIAEPGEAFTSDWIGEGGRAHVGRYALDPGHAIRLVRGAGGVTALAHPRAGRPWTVSDEQIAGLAAAGLAGVEVFHPDHPDTERAGLLALAEDLHLVATGGSDDHGSLTGHRIGCETVTADAYHRLISQANGLRSALLGGLNQDLRPPARRHRRPARGELRRRFCPQRVTVPGGSARCGRKVRRVSNAGHGRTNPPDPAAGRKRPDDRTDRSGVTGRGRGQRLDCR